MDLAIVFTAGVAGVLTALLSLDLVVAAVRQRHVLRRRVDRPLRLIVGSTVLAATLLGATRPVPAVTPPPTVRILDASTAPGPATELAIAVDDSSAYVVERGDSLWRIARSVLAESGHPAEGRDVARFWPEIYEANRDLIGDDPNLIHPGQRLAIPTPEAPHGT